MIAICIESRIIWEEHAGAICRKWIRQIAIGKANPSTHLLPDPVDRLNRLRCISAPPRLVDGLGGEVGRAGLGAARRFCQRYARVAYVRSPTRRRAGWLPPPAHPPLRFPAPMRLPPGSSQNPPVGFRTSLRHSPRDLKRTRSTLAGQHRSTSTPSNGVRQAHSTAIGSPGRRGDTLRLGETRRLAWRNAQWFGATPAFREECRRADRRVLRGDRTRLAISFRQLAKMTWACASTNRMPQSN